MEKDIVKILFQVKLTGSTSVYIRICRIDPVIHDFMSPILYHTSDGFIFEKNLKFNIVHNRCVLPVKISNNKIINTIVKTFNTDKERKLFLSYFKKQLDQFTRSVVLENKNHKEKDFYKVKFKGQFWMIY